MHSVRVRSIRPVLHVATGEKRRYKGRAAITSPTTPDNEKMIENPPEMIIPQQVQQEVKI